MQLGELGSWHSCEKQCREGKVKVGATTHSVPWAPIALSSAASHTSQQVRTRSEMKPINVLAANVSDSAAAQQCKQRLRAWHTEQRTVYGMRAPHIRQLHAAGMHSVTAAVQLDVVSAPACGQCWRVNGGTDTNCT